MEATKQGHTPGPWRSLHAPGKTVDIVCDSRTRTIAQTYGENRTGNALLIAAAPDLLAACAGLVAYADSLSPDNVYQAEAIMLFRDQIEPMRAAVAKAVRS